MLEKPKNVELSGRKYEATKSLYLMNFAYENLDDEEFYNGIGLIAEKVTLRNIGEHCAAAGVCADILCKLLGIKGERQNRIVRASMLHDFGKIEEIRAFRRINDHTPEKVIQAMKLIEGDVQRRLESLRISDEKVIELMKVVVPKTAHGPEEIDEMIVWYVDAMLKETEPTTIETRMSEVVTEDVDRERAKRNLAIDRMYKERYGGKTLRQVQIEISKRISAEFAKKIKERTGISINPSDLPKFLRCKLDERLVEFDFERCLQGLDEEREKAQAMTDVMQGSYLELKNKSLREICWFILTPGSQTIDTFKLKDEDFSKENLLQLYSQF